MIAITEAPAWTRDALCREYPSQWWFPERNSSHRRARKVCRECLVREECLSFALESHERYGIWGGFNFHDITALRRARWDHACRLCRGRIPLVDVAELAVAEVEPSRWCCSACRQQQIQRLAAS